MSIAPLSLPHDFLPAPVRRVAPYLVLALAVFAAYGNIYDNVFLFDDDLLLVSNGYLRGWDHVFDLLTGSTTAGAHIAGGFYRPVQMLLYLLITHLGDGSPFLFHVLNLSLHVANTCFVYRIGTKVGFDRRGVFLAALLWGVHPLHTEAVTYVSATADPLFAFFCLWAIAVLVPDISPRKIFAVIPLFLLALLSKETAVMFPLLVMCCLFLTSPDRLKIGIYWRTWPLWVMSGVYLVWRLHAKDLAGPQAYSVIYGMPQFAALKAYADHPDDRIYTFLATLPAYLKLLVWPTGLHMERSFPVFYDPFRAPVVTGGIMFLLTAALIIYSCRTKRGIEMSWGLLWFAAAHGPDSGLMVPVNSLFLEHWMYLPSVGLFLGLAQTCARLRQTRFHLVPEIGGAAAVGFAVLLAVMTYNQNKIWSDRPSFYSNIFAYGEPSARAHNNLALYYLDVNQNEQAIEQFNQAIKISDTYAETHYNLALAYLREPDRNVHLNEALANLHRSLEIDPNFYRSYKTLGDIYALILHDKKTADTYYARAKEIFNRPQ